MTEEEEYGLEDICVALDEVALQLKRLVTIRKVEAKRLCMKPNQIVEIDQI